MRIEHVVNARPHLRRAYELAKLIQAHCEDTDEKWWLVRALLMWVERHGALQDLGYTLMWLDYTIGHRARAPLRPKPECHLADVRRIRRELEGLANILAGPKALAA